MCCAPFFFSFFSSPFSGFISMSLIVHQLACAIALISIKECLAYTRNSSPPLNQASGRKKSDFTEWTRGNNFIQKRRNEKERRQKDLLSMPRSMRARGPYFWVWSLLVSAFQGARDAAATQTLSPTTASKPPIWDSNTRREPGALHPPQTWQHKHARALSTAGEGNGEKCPKRQPRCSFPSRAADRVSGQIFGRAQLDGCTSCFSLQNCRLHELLFLFLCINIYIHTKNELAFFILFPVPQVGLASSAKASVC